MAQEGVRGYRVTARAVDDVALDPPEVGHRTKGLPGAGRDGSRGLEERGDAVAFVPAARRRDGTAGGVAPDAAACKPVKRSEAAQRPQLNPRPPDAEPARSAGGADTAGKGRGRQPHATR